MSKTTELVDDALRRFAEAAKEGKPTVEIFRCNAEALAEEIAVLREQLEVSVDRAESWKNIAEHHQRELNVVKEEYTASIAHGQSWKSLCEKYKEVAEARGEALDKMRAQGIR